MQNEKNRIADKNESNNHKLETYVTKLHTFTLNDDTEQRKNVI